MSTVIIDTQVANIQSLASSLRYLRTNFIVSDDPLVAEKATKIFLPGVGSFSKAKEQLDLRGLTQVLLNIIQDGKTSILGICLGMQLLSDGSEEGPSDMGLGVYPGKVTKLVENCSVKIPHVGMNSVDFLGNSSLTSGIANGSDFYFVHSYALMINNSSSIVGVTNHGSIFASVMDNGKGVFGVQFHPEKSRKPGLRLIENFLKI